MHRQISNYTLNKTNRSGLVASSEGLGWQSLTLSSWQAVDPLETGAVQLPHHLLVIYTNPQPVQLFERTNGAPTKGVANFGQINLLNAGVDSTCRWEQPLSFLRLDFSPQFLHTLAAQTEGLNPDRVELANQYRFHDPKVAQIVHWLADEVQNGAPGGKLYADSLANVLGLHLLRNHNITTPVTTLGGNRLSQEQVKRAVEYMGNHLAYDISLEDLAQSVNVSASHLGRLFKETIGMPPHQYLIKLRVERAHQLLQGGRHAISDVALQVGFTDQSHLHRHFKRIYGVTPKAVLGR